MAKIPVYISQCVGFVNYGDGWKHFFADKPWEKSAGLEVKWYTMKIPVPEELLLDDVVGEVTMEKIDGQS